MVLAQQPDLTVHDARELQRRWLASDPADPQSRTHRDTILQRLRGDGPPIADNPAEPMDLRGIDLSGQDLSEVNFTGSDLSGANLSETNLTRATLSWSHLRSATLYRAILDEAECLNANFSEANCNDCQANRAGFGAAILTGATLFGAQLQEATFSKAQLDGTDFRTANLAGARMRQADLTHSNFAHANLRGIDLTGSRVPRAIFEDTDLRAAHLRDITGYLTASWLRADVRDVDFCGAYMVRRHIMDENFLHEFRRQSQTYEYIYQLWRATSDCGRNISRWGVCTASIAIVFAMLFLLVDIDYGENKTFFSPLYYSIITITTLGYGDILPKSAAAQMLASLEVILGYVAGGGLISILANKMSRRAE